MLTDVYRRDSVGRLWRKKSKRMTAHDMHGPAS